MEYFVPALFVILGIFLLTVAAKTIKIVPQATVMLIERLGRFSRVAASGLNIIVPFLDKPRGVYWTNMRPGHTSIDLREQFLDLPPQPVITRAEGEKQAAITRAEGEKESAILQADGAAQARLRNVAAESEAIARIAQALEGHGNPAQYLITQRYIESLRDMTRTNNSKVIFMPVETASMLSSVGAIKEMLSETGEKRASDDDRQPPTRPRQL